MDQETGHKDVNKHQLYFPFIMMLASGTVAFFFFPPSNFNLILGGNQKAMAIT